MMQKAEKLRTDHRPYIIKKLYQDFQKHYVKWFLCPQFEYLGRGCTFMKPWYVEVFGGPVSLGNYATVIATTDGRVRLTVWTSMGQEGSIYIGNYCLICPGVRISAGKEIVIGDSCMLANGVFVTDSDWHGVYDRSLPVGKSVPVSIEDNVWIGDSALVCKGVKIGRNSIIGAGSVVVGDIPENAIAAGNPATVIKYLDKDEPLKTRADWFADPKTLARQFEEIDRSFMRHNTWHGWIRSLLYPRKGD
jgi:acetyltransferase-like isoleucine patch superfamily enzyme